MTVIVAYWYILYASDSEQFFSNIFECLNNRSASEKRGLIGNPSVHKMTNCNPEKAYHPLYLGGLNPVVQINLCPFSTPFNYGISWNLENIGPEKLKENVIHISDNLNSKKTGSKLSICCSIPKNISRMFGWRQQQSSGLLRTSDDQYDKNENWRVRIRRLPGSQHALH